MMKGFEWGKNIPEDIKELKNYNGVIVTFDFFEGVFSENYKISDKFIKRKNDHGEKEPHFILGGFLMMRSLKKS